MPSFDVVSKLDDHELTNAVDQANRELDKRFDFKGSGASFELGENLVTLKADAEFRLKQMEDILMQRLAARGIDIRCAEVKEPDTNLASARQQIVLKQGIDQSLGKKLAKLLKDSGLKVQAQIQGDQLGCPAEARRPAGSHRFCARPMWNAAAVRKLPRLSPHRSRTMLPPINLQTWIEEHRHRCARRSATSAFTPATSS